MSNYRKDFKYAETRPLFPPFFPHIEAEGDGWIVTFEKGFLFEKGFDGNTWSVDNVSDSFDLTDGDHLFVLRGSTRGAIEIKQNDNSDLGDDFGYPLCLLKKEVDQAPTIEQIYMCDGVLLDVDKRLGFSSFKDGEENWFVEEGCVFMPNETSPQLVWFDRTETEGDGVALKVTVTPKSEQTNVLYAINDDGQAGYDTTEEMERYKIVGAADFLAEMVLMNDLLDMRNSPAEIDPVDGSHVNDGVFYIPLCQQEDQFLYGPLALRLTEHGTLSVSPCLALNPS